MTITEIIESFKSRVDLITEEWENITKFPIYSDIDKVIRLENKLDIVQEQNYSIIIDLNNIKRELNMDITEENVVFCSKITDDAQENIERLLSDEKILESSPVSYATVNDVNDVNEYLKIDENDDDIILSSIPETQEYVESDNDENMNYDVQTEPIIVDNELRSSISILDINKRYSNREIATIKNFELNMIETPKNIHQLYDDFDKNLRHQIKEFETTFGKGQLSKLNKIRTYQRRRALICEIEKFSKIFSVDLNHAMEFFDNFRKSRGKTVPWLYNNLAKIVEEVKLEYKLQHLKNFQ